MQCFAAVVQLVQVVAKAVHSHSMSARLGPASLSSVRLWIPLVWFVQQCCKNKHHHPRRLALKGLLAKRKIYAR